jgi:hypothetical protein
MFLTSTHEKIELVIQFQPLNKGKRDGSTAAHPIASLSQESYSVRCPSDSIL